MALVDRDYRSGGWSDEGCVDRDWWARWQVAGHGGPRLVTEQADSEGGADGLADDVRHERSHPTERELAQPAADG
jgi:hypothetical protein